MKNINAILALVLIISLMLGCNNFGEKKGGGDAPKMPDIGKSDDKKDDKGEKKAPLPDSRKVPLPPSKKQDNDEPTPNQGGGKTVAFKVAGVQMNLPDGWEYENLSDRFIVKSPDGNLQVFFYIPEQGNFQDAVDTVVGEMRQYLENINAEFENERSSSNGIDTISSGGKALYEGTPVLWMIYVYKAPNAPLFTVTVTDPEYYGQHKESYSAMMKSVRRL